MDINNKPHYSGENVWSYSLEISMDSINDPLRKFLEEKFGKHIIAGYKNIYFHHLIADRGVNYKDFGVAAHAVLDYVIERKQENEFKSDSLHMFVIVLLWEIFDLFNIEFLSNTRTVMRDYAKANIDLLSDTFLLKTYGHDSYNFPSESAQTLKRLFDMMNPSLIIFDNFERLNINNKSSLVEFFTGVHRTEFIKLLIDNATEVVDNNITKQKLTDFLQKITQQQNKVFVESHSTKTP